MNTLTKFAHRYRYSVILLRQMVITDFKLRYQGSVLGYLWSLLKPLALFAILYVVFVNFLKIGQGVPNFPIYLLLGIVIWSYFTEVTNNGIKTIVDRGELLRKINFPRYVVVLAAAVSALINLILNLIVVGVFMAFTDVHFGLNLAWAPLLIFEIFVLALAAAFYLSALYVKFRDLVYIWEVFLQGAFYATPIIYPLNIVPVEYAKWLSLNPIAQVVQDIRYVAITDHTITLTTLFGNPWIRVIPVGITVAIAVGAYLYFRRQARYFAEEV